MKKDRQHKIRYEAIIETWVNSEKTEAAYGASGIYRQTYQAAYQDAVAGGTGDMAGCVMQTNTVGGQVHRLFAQEDIDRAIRHDAMIRRQRRTA